MSRNGQPHIEAIELPLCLVCGKGFTHGEKVVVSQPELIFIHLGCVEDVDEALIGNWQTGVGSPSRSSGDGNEMPSNRLEGNE